MSTQQEIAEHLDLSERRVRDLLQELGVPHKTASLERIRIAYIRDLREKAAGRSGEDHAALTKARTLDAVASAELKNLQIKEKAKFLVPLAEVEPALLAMVTAARTELLTLPGNLAQELQALYGVEIDPAIIESRIHDALANLADHLQDHLAGDVAASGEGVGATVEAEHDRLGE